MNETPLPGQLGQMITGYWISQLIYAAARFSIADHLADGPVSVDDLAKSTGTKPELLYRLLRALASVGVFAEREPRCFELTPLAEFLRRDVPGSQRSMALMMGDDHFLAWSKLVDTLQTGENAYQTVFGKPIFEDLAEKPEKAKIFDDAMTGIHGRETQAILDAYDFSDISVLADIGGGNGSKITAILQEYSSMKGILFDLPHVVQRAQDRVDSLGLTSRCDLVGGDFFRSVPSGADAYIMRHIIHDWNDEQSQTILANCHRVMPPGSKLLVVESVIPPGNDPCFAKLLDLTMMLIPGGKERTEVEFRELFDCAGFELTRIVPTASDVSVIEGVRR